MNARLIPQFVAHGFGQGAWQNGDIKESVCQATRRENLHQCKIAKSRSYDIQSLLEVYARYWYGNARIHHSAIQLDEYAAMARECNLVTIASYFGELADKAEEQEIRQEREDFVQAKAHVEYLRNDYR